MPVIETSNLGKRYRLGGQQRVYASLREDLLTLLRRPLAARAPRVDPTYWALEEVDLAVEQGEVVGVIGRNGAGKSTLLKILSRITRPTTGWARLEGRVGSLLEVGTGFHPELSGRENVFLSGAILGMRRGEIANAFDEIVDFAGVDRFIDTPVKHYSSGMYVRLAFAVAAHLNPEILLVDEVLAVGDADFQKRCLGKMREVAQSGRTVLFVSHNLNSVVNLCGRAVLLERGRVAFDGEPKRAVEHYLDTGSGLRAREVDLREHPGRRGGSTALLERLRVVGEGMPRTGAPLAFEIDYDARGSGCDHAMLLVSSLLGERLITLGTHQVRPGGMPLPERGVLRCELPSLQLRDGEYRVDVSLGRRSPPRNLDLVEDALRLQVAFDDYFGTGAELLPGQGSFAFRSQWQVRARGDTG